MNNERKINNLLVDKADLNKACEAAQFGCQSTNDGLIRTK